MPFENDPQLDKVQFTYPGAPRPQISNVHVMCRLSSRVAVLGVNGAGKSTLIKVCVCGGGEGGFGLSSNPLPLRLLLAAACDL
jgi:ATPase subunit of ABC transporter with duplicated ATPase domains